MRYSFLILVTLAGCNLDENFAPSLSAVLAPDGSGTSVIVTYQRGTGHDFSDMHGTINGSDIGPAAIDEGNEQTNDGQFFGGGQGANPAKATWRLDPATVGPTAHIVIDDGDEFIIDVTFGQHGTVTNDCSSNLTC